MTDKQGALHGVRVLDLSRMLPGPFCTMVLGDHGAEVIAIENRSLYQEDLFFGDLYRNKYHISLNLKSEKGLEIFRQLAADADVIVEGFRPGVARRLGVDYETVSSYNPRIVYCAISGYGQDGPCRDMPGHDVNYLAKTGILALIGEKNHPPVIPGVQVGDIVGGAMQAALGIMMALYHREKSGRGQYIDISMTDGLLGLLMLPMTQSRREKRPVRASDGRFCHRFACYSTYTTADNRYLALGALEPKFWQALCASIDRPQYIDLQYDEEAQEEIVQGLQEVFRTKTMAQWDEIFSRVDACCCGIATFDEVLNDAHFKARNMVHLPDGKDVETDGVIGIPIKLGATPGSIRREPPGFGSDTLEVLGRLGYHGDAIEAFRKEGVV